MLKFPNGFLWGSATSSHQVEGNNIHNDWWEAEQTGKLKYKSGKTCEHYNRYEQDFDLIKKLNQNAHRFSIEWSRIEPKEGEFNQKEIEHYRKVLLALKKRDIKIMLTLHHFATPLWLAKKGGWANPKVIFYFSRFAEKVFKEYQDLVDFWVTINEPFLVYAIYSYLLGIFPPQKRNPILFLKVAKNQIAVHKKIYNVFHKLNSDVKVGIAKHNSCVEPYFSKFPLDKLSAKLARYFGNEYFLNRIKNHQDFIGLNYYFHNKILFPFFTKNENKIVSNLNWEIYPKGIYYVLKELKKYKKPIYITENGLADSKDRLREDFIKDHLFWLHKAIEQGVDVRGYFHWSLMDNFEWAEGFSPRFGLIEVDYKSMKRTIRPSALEYAKICKENQLCCG
ncbi:glycoside hydrolase family 1 protein [Candidatus Parcubacteria bacterium]|nr:glycoside hydrolase family 1 protein [Candidatus Parcubacteria bacterium]